MSTDEPERLSFEKDLLDYVGDTKTVEGMNRLVQVSLEILLQYAIEEHRACMSFGDGSPEHLAAIRDTKETIASCPLDPKMLVHMILAKIAMEMEE